MQQVFLKMVPDGVNPVIYATQNDDGRVFRFKLLNSDESDAYVLNGTETITAKIVKPDNTEITIAITNPGIGKDYCDMVIGSDDCDLAGVYIGEVSLLDYGRPLGSLNFILKVEPDAYDGVNVVVMDCGPADICTFETNLADTLVSLTANITASGGGGTPSTPIPIVGISSLDIVRCGVNLWALNDSYSVAGAGYLVNNVAFYIPKGTYNFNYSTALTSGATAFSIKDSDGNALTTIYINNGTNNGSFTITEEGHFVSVYSNTAGTYTDLQINLGSSALPYAPYNGQTFTVSFGQTVYGGVYDANVGKIRITHELITPTAAQVVTVNNLTCVRGVCASIKEAGHQTDIISSHFGLVTNNSDVADGTIVNQFWQYYNLVFCSPSNFQTVAEFETWVSNNNVKICIPLATPIEIDVSELSVAAIVGVNNVFADTGETELKYLKIEG